MNKGILKIVFLKRFFLLSLVFILALVLGCTAPGKKTAVKKSDPGQGPAALAPPVTIPDNVSCGKCGMYPARYPKWQSQVIFTDGSMTPFDGCKCLYNFLFAMETFDNTHTRNDVAVAWVKDFNSGKWINAVEAHYVVGSKMMGPMGKELIPFGDQTAAMKFQQVQGGTLMKYSEITPAVLKSLEMGGRHMKHGSGHKEL